MCTNIHQVNLMFKDLLLYIMIVYLNVLGPHVKHWVVCSCMLLMLSQYRVIGLSTLHPKLCNSLRNQAISHVAIVAPLFFAFVLDKATVGCFLLLQLTAPLPRLKT